MVYRNIEVTKLEPGSNPMKVAANPPMELFEGLHKFVKITGKYLVQDSLNCIYTLGKEKLISIAIVFSETDVRCDLPNTTFRANSGSIELHLSLNGGLSQEVLSPANLNTKFTILYKPQIERVAITGGFSTRTSNFVTIGRSETKTVTLSGINLNSALGKSPVCLFESQF